MAADKTRALKTSRGYVGLREEQLDVTSAGRPDVKEVLDLGLPLGNSTLTYLGSNPWPAAMPSLQSATQAYLKAAYGVGNELLSVVARSVGLPDDGLSGVFDEPLVVQRLIRYPARSSVLGANVIGCGAHYDFGGLTLLKQSVPGLQVQPPVSSVDERRVAVNGAAYGTTQGTFFSDIQNVHSSEWLAVDAVPEYLVVTYGEALQRLTNGKIQATRHRVIHDGDADRHSMAVFVDPNPNRLVKPLPTIADDAPKYAARLAGHKTVPLANTSSTSNTSSANFGPYLGYGHM